MKGLIMMDPDEVRTIFMVLFMVFEPIRLVAGYYGNLREEVRGLLPAHGDRLQQPIDTRANAGSSVAGADFTQHYPNSTSMYIYVCGSVSHGLIPAGPSMATACVPACQHRIWKLCRAPSPVHGHHEQLVSRRALVTPSAATHLIGSPGLQLYNVYNLNQRQQAIMKSSEMEMHQQKWATKPLISTATRSGQLRAKQMDNMRTSHRNGDGGGDLSGV